MTPRTFWDQDLYLWEQHPADPTLLRSVWSHGLQKTQDSPRWVKRWALEHCGIVLVASS